MDRAYGHTGLLGMPFIIIVTPPSKYPYINRKGKKCKVKQYV